MPATRIHRRPFVCLAGSLVSAVRLFTKKR